MKKFMILLSSLFIIASLFTGCGKKEVVNEEEVEEVEVEVEDAEDAEDADEETAGGDVTEAFAEYQAFLATFGERETEIMEYYNSLENVSEQEAQKAIVDEIIPAYKELIKFVEEFTPGSEDIAELHGQYLGGCYIYLDALELMATAISEDDETTAAEANLNIELAKEIMLDWSANIEQLASENK